MLCLVLTSFDSLSMKRSDSTLVCLLQDQDGAAEHAGPLAEIEFWRSRTVDLGGIRDQLDDTSEQLQQDITCNVSQHTAADFMCTSD